MARLAQILAETHTLIIDKYDGLSVTYRPNALTPETHDAAIALLEKQRGGAAVAQSLALVLVSWDLIDENDQPYPTDEQSLRTLPNRFLEDVFTAIVNDQRPNPTKPQASGGSF